MPQICSGIRSQMGFFRVKNEAGFLSLSTTKASDVFGALKKVYLGCHQCLSVSTAWSREPRSRARLNSPLRAISHLVDSEFVQI